MNGKRTDNSLPNKMIYCDRIANCDDEKAELFAEFLKSVYVEHDNDDSLLIFINERNDRGCSVIEVIFEMVHQVLSTLDLRKGMGPDRVSPFYLRECADQLAGPLSIIYSKSLNDNIFPDKL